ncbi:hypothetical protein [Pseudorhodoplanes sinuspersici]|uniref:Uncharacterized protein n=1 Tax=Pseudorhodoplanes sinuspersici TaxID=1235591 RepID=A0A1W6ZYW9_9HYPH|nr:hypothetical protein [Pseudorhodoplanes sinuspersici]ARQ02572.1 hypothetical protein CAK95_28275 [Pseudorhodoplanes sinuspersici]RKE74425.1 hypothetical protein DFP91_2336 [Pseudorhodoplanes sinuspersici]
MPLFPVHQKFVDDFFAEVARYEAGYAHVAFNFVAIRSEDRFVIVQGRLFLNSIDPKMPTYIFQSPNVRAGRYQLSELKLDMRAFVAQLLTGKITTPDGDLHFVAIQNGDYAVSYMPFHPDGLQNQNRTSVLRLMAGPVTIAQPNIDWEVKSATPPYDGLQELATELGFGSISVATSTIEIIAFNVAAIDMQDSKVSGSTAVLGVVVASGLDSEKVKLGYRVYNPALPTERKTVEGASMVWTNDGALKRGRTEVQVPPAAVINCVVSYDGCALHHQWVGDPERSQNSRRAVYEAFDPKLEALEGMIRNASMRGQDARQLEPAVAWIMWMLGFSVVHLGGMPRTRDAADLIAVSPAGHFLVVECTTGLLKAENKLALLHARAEAVRRSLAASNNTYQRVLPMIVTSKTVAEVKPDMEAAGRLGIRVVTMETVEQAINRTLIQPNADQMFFDAENAVKAELAKYEAEPALPLIDTPLPKV